MYTPLKFMEQVENMIKLHNIKNYDNIANSKACEFYNKLLSTSRETCFFEWVLEWNKCNQDKDYIGTPYVVWKNLFESAIGIECMEPVDFYGASMQYSIWYDWHKNKKVYKVEDAMCHDFATMKVPFKVSSDVLTKLPSKCFYIEPEYNLGFNGDPSGLFISYDIMNGDVMMVITAIFDDDRVVPVYTSLSFPDAGNAKYVGLDITDFMDDTVVYLEDGRKINYNERKLAQFVFNFLIYLHAANKDVVYTERTKAIYKPNHNDKKPKNKMREIEEFGVGFNIGAKISASTPRVRVKYVGNQNNTPTKKRAYSSNYRSAHWHHYWVNDAESANGKKLIVKWVAETYVKGNTDSNKVTIRKVTK